MKKIIFTLTALTLVVCSAFADYMVIDNELNSYAKTNEVVSSFNTLTGVVSIEGGSNITLSTNDNVITISASGGEFTQVQSDWEEEDTTDPAYIANKPTIPTVPTIEAGDNVTITTTNNTINIAATDTVFDPEDIGVNTYSPDANSTFVSEIYFWDETTIEARSLTIDGGRIIENGNRQVAYTTDLPHLIPGSNISIATNGTDITISATASSSSAATHSTQFSVQDEDISGNTYNVSLDYSEQWFETTTGASGTKTLNVPAKTTASDVGYLTLYLDETYQYEEYFDISPDNISGLPSNKPWLNSEGSLFSVWKVEFETIPNGTNWYFVKATEYVIVAAQPEDQADIYLQFESGTFPSYSGTSFNAYNTTTESDVAMTCQRLNKGNSADDKKVGTTALRLAPAKDGLDGYFYNTTAFASPVTALSFQYAKYGTDTCESFKVYTSTDGSTWTELVDLTSTITESLQTYSNDSTIPADTYFIKFENTSSVSTSTNSRKLDVDEIEIWLTPSNGE